MKPTTLHSTATKLLIAAGLTLLAWVSGWRIGIWANPAHAAALLPEDQSPQMALRTAWQRLQSAETYQFAADIEQTRFPVATVGNVGQQSEQETMHIEGAVQRPAQQMTLTLWSQGGNVLDPDNGIAIKVEGERAYARTGTDEWQEIENFTGLFAPGGDFSAFLAAASEIALEPAASELPHYTFNIDGPAFAAYVVKQMEQQARQKGELPPGVEMGLPEAFVQMTGSGEIWLDTAGNPLRQVIQLKFPPQEAEWVEARLDMTFAGVTQPLTASTSPLFALSLPSTYGIAFLAGLIFLLSRAKKSRKIYAALIGVLLVSMVLSPLLQSAQAADYFGERKKRAAAIEESRQPGEMEQSLTNLQQEQAAAHLPANTALAALAKDDRRDTDQDGLSDVQEMVLGTSALDYASTDFGLSDLAAAQALLGVRAAHLHADTGVDSDADGLTDYQEDMLGTSSSALDEDEDGVPDGRDSDGDGVGDAAEVVGFEYNSHRYYTDPLKSDTNQDGLSDGLEWNHPATAHATWDLDGDGQPDTFDRDNDGDGVPDNIDLSPYINPTNTFTPASPFALRINGLSANQLTYVEFQLRPTNENHLRYAFNVMDWPSDNAGQMQDLDNATFYDANPSLAANPNRNGDVKLIPMLEIRTSGVPSNLPLTSDFPATALTLQEDRSSGIGGSVTIDMAGGNATFQYASLSPATLIHAVYRGGCNDLSSPAYALSPDGGGLATLSGITMQTLMDSPHAIVASRTANLADGYACANIPQLPREGTQWVDTTLLGHYGVIALAAGGENKTLYVPLQLTTIQKTGEKVAFYGKMIYQPAAGTWGAPQDARLVWMVQALVDHCTEPTLAACYLLNNPQVLHTYADDFRLTGINVRENRGFETAVIYEDPNVDNDLNRDDSLIFLSYSLQETFLAGEDCDTVVNDVCQGNGQLDYPIAELRRRFDHETNGSTTPAERWELPNLFSVHTFTYAHPDQANADISSVQIPAILAAEFTPGTIPTLMVASTQRYRAANLDASLVVGNVQAAWSGNQLTFDLTTSQEYEVAGLTWSPYRYDGSAWVNENMSAFWDTVGSRYAADFAADPVHDENDTDEKNGKLVFVRLYHLALNQGVSRVVRLNGYGLRAASLPEKPISLQAVDVIGKIGKFLFNKVYFLAVKDLANPALTMQYLGKLGEKIVTSAPLGGAVLKLFRMEASATVKAARGMVIVAAVLAAVTAVSFLFAYLLSLNSDTPVARVIVQIGDTISTAVSVFMSLLKPLWSAKIWNPVTFLTNLTSLSSAIGSSFFGAVLSLIVEVGLIWGTFVYAFIFGAAQVGSMAFSSMLALTIAQTILAILFFALSLTVAGTLLVGIINAIDAILSLLCKSFGVESACFSISDTMAKAIAGNYFGIAPTIDMGLSEIGVVRDLDINLTNSDLGFIPGNTLRIQATVYNRLVQNLVGDPADMARMAYHAGDLFTEEDLKRASIKYAINAQAPAAIAGDMQSAWATSRSTTLTAYVPWIVAQAPVVFDVYQGEAESTTGVGTAVLPAFGKNRPIEADLYFSYAIPAAECWGARAASFCQDRDVTGAQKIGSLGIVLDIFPPTLDGFYTMLNTWSDQLDYDGDSLTQSGVIGLDPNDANWDLDGDRVPDGKEAELRQQGVGLLFENAATGYDTDGDGLPDGEELCLGTNPAEPDTDRDGLTDLEELNGWLWAYSADGLLQTMVTSDPTIADTDGDGNLDGLERNLYQLDPIAYPLHPRHVDPSYITVAAQISDEDGYVGSGQVFTYTVKVSNTTPITHPLSVDGTAIYTEIDERFASLLTLSPLTGEFNNVASGQAAVMTAQAQVMSGYTLPDEMGLRSNITANFFEPDEIAALAWVDQGGQQWTPNDADYSPRLAALAPVTGWDTSFYQVALEESGYLQDTNLTGRIAAYGLGVGMTPLSTLENNPAYLYALTPPAVACNTVTGLGNRCLAVWARKESAASSSFALIGQLINRNGVTFNQAFTIADETCDETQPAVASNGVNFLVTWACGGSVYARTVDNFQSDDPTTPITQLDSLAANPELYDLAPAIAWTGNRYTIAWQKGDAPTANTLYAAQFDANGAALGSGLNLGVSSHNARQQRLAYHPPSESALLVTIHGTSVDALRLTHVTAGLTPSAAFRIASLGSDSAIYNPQVAYDPRLNAWMVAWSAATAATPIARWQSVTADGELQGTQHSISYTGQVISGADAGLGCSALECQWVVHSDILQPLAGRFYFLEKRALKATHTYFGAAVAAAQTIRFTVEFDDPDMDNAVAGIPASMHLKAGSYIVLGGSAWDELAGVDRVEVSLDGGPWQAAEGHETWTYGFNVPAEGRYNLDFQVVDRAGNIGGGPGFIILADGTPPAITHDQADGLILQAGLNVNGRYTIPLSGSVADPSVAHYVADNNNLTLEVSVTPNGNGWQPATVNGTNWSLDYPLSTLTDPSGTYTITLRAADSAGNLTPVGAYPTFQVTLDNTPPQSSLTNPDPGSFTIAGNTLTIYDAASTLITQTIVVAGTVSDPAVGAGVADQSLRFSPVDVAVEPGLWRGKYYAASTPLGAATLTRTDEETDGALAFDWGTNAPAADLPVEHFSAAWERQALFRTSGVYTFTLSKDNSSLAQVYLDGSPQLALPTTQTGSSIGVLVEQGIHALKVIYVAQGGSAAVSFSAELAQANWLATTLTAAGPGVAATTWQYPLAATLEGFYALDLRGGDVVGNSSTAANQPWQGEIDTAAPRISLEMEYTGSGVTARTTYRIQATDFNLTDAGWVSPCALEASDYHDYTSAWYAQWFPGDQRLFTIVAECSVAGHMTTQPALTACDRYGHCATNTTQPPTPPDQKMIYLVQGTPGDAALIKLDLSTGLTQTLRTSGIANALAVDPTSGQIYAPDAAGNIWRIHNTTGAATLFYADSVVGADYTVAQNTLYWSDPTNGLRSVQTDGSGFATRVAPGVVGLDNIPAWGHLFASGANGGMGQVIRWVSNSRAEMNGLDPAFYNSWIGEFVAVNMDNQALYVAGDCGDPYGGSAGTPRNVIGGIHRLPSFTQVTGVQNGVTGCFPVVTLADPLDQIADIGFDDSSNKLYYLLYDASVGQSSLWRANPDGSSPEMVYASITPLHAFAIDDSNRQPSAFDSTSYTTSDTPVQTRLATSDSDGDLMTFTIIDPPDGGVLSNLPVGPSAQVSWVTYTPNPLFNGLDSFTFRADDGRGGSAVGVVSIDVTGNFVDATILSPAPDTFIHLGETVTITVALRADRGIRLMRTYNNGDGIDYQDMWSGTGITETIYSFAYTPLTQGRHDLTTRLVDEGGKAQTLTPIVTIYVTHDAPTVAITPTIITTTHQANYYGRLYFYGTASDSTGWHVVSVQVNGAAAQSSLSEPWQIPFSQTTPPDGVTYAVTATVRDRFNVTAAASASVLADLVLPAPVAVTMGLQGQGSLSAEAFVRTPNPTLTLDWSASSDGSGIAGYYAGWTTSATPPAASALAFYATPTQHLQMITQDGAAYYAHLGICDGLGNLRWQTLGPIYVDAPGTPDLIQPDSYLGWMDNPGVQVSADYELSRSPSAPADVQKFYVTWDSDRLALAWSGALFYDNANDGKDLYIYLDTGEPGGATHMLDGNPAIVETIGLPAEGGIPLTADYLLHVTARRTAWLYHWDGAAWQAVRHANFFSSANYTEWYAPDFPGFTVSGSFSPLPYLVLKIPFALLNITDPAAASLNLVAALTNDNDARLQAAAPDHNPLNAAPVLSSLAYEQQDAIANFALTQQYTWPTLGSGILPNADQFNAADLDVWVSAEPAGLGVGYLASDWYHRLIPGAPLDADHNGIIDQPLPYAPADPVTNGQTILYTVHYTNRGDGVATGATLDLAYLGGLSGGATALPLGDVAPGASGTLTLTAQMNAGAGVSSGELLVSVSDATHGDYDWYWVFHQNDVNAPSDVTITAPNGVINGNAAQWIYGTASDDTGVTAIEIEETLPDSTVFTEICTLGSPTQNAWQCYAPLAAVSGVHTLRARAYDAEGRISPWSAPHAVTLDLNRPVLSLDADAQTLLNNTIFTGTIPFAGALVDDLTARSVEVCLNDRGYYPYCTSLPARPGNAPAATWGDDIAPPYSWEMDGEVISYTLRGFDSAGNASTELIGTTRLDNYAPRLILSTCTHSVYLDGYLPGGDPIVSSLPGATGFAWDGSGLNAFSVVWRDPLGVSHSSTIPVDATDNWSFFPTVELPGTYTMDFDITDSAGNGSRAACRFQVIPRTDLGLSLSAAPTSLLNTQPVTFTFTITNSNAGTATGVNLGFYAHSSIEVLDVAPPSTVCSGAEGWWNCAVSDIAAGAVQTITLQARQHVDGSGSSYLNAWVSSTSTDPNLTNNNASATISYNFGADLSISQAWQSPDLHLWPGGLVTYTVQVTNTGPSRLLASEGHWVRVANRLPANWGYAAGGGNGWTCVYTPTNTDALECSLPGGLDVAAAPPLVITLTQPSQPGLYIGAFSNWVSVFPVPNADPDPTDNSSQFDGQIVADADLVIEQSVTPTATLPGGWLTYIFTATQRGPDPALAVTVAGEFPNTLQLQAIDADCGRFWNQYECSLPLMMPGETYVYTASVSVASNGSYPHNTWVTNTVSIASTSIHELQPADNSAVTSLWVVPSADLLGTISVTPAAAPIGHPLTYTIQIANAGPDATSGPITVVDTLPNGIAFQSAAGVGWNCANVGQVITCTHPAMVVGAAPDIIIGGVIVTGQASYVNTGAVSGPDFDPWPADYNNIFQVSSSLDALTDIALSKSASAVAVQLGDTLMYTLTATNNGPDFSGILTLVDTLPPQVAFVSLSQSAGVCQHAAGVLTCDAWALSPGETRQVIVRTTVISATELITNTASISMAGVYESNPANNTAQAVVRPRTSDLSVSASAAPAYLGWETQLSLRVTNLGPDADSAVVTTTFSGAFSYFDWAVFSPGWVCAGNPVAVCTHSAALAAGEVTTLTLPVSANALSGFTAQVEVTGGYFDPVSGNNRTTLNVTAQAATDLTLTKSVQTPYGASDPWGTMPPPVVTPGGLVTYTLAIENFSNSDALTVTLTDTLPDGMTFVGFSEPGPWDCSASGANLTCTLPTLAAWGSAQVTFQANAPVAPGLVTNEAVVTSTIAEYQPGDNLASVALRVGYPVDLNVVAEPATPTAYIGQPFTVTLNVHNAGPFAANVVLTDTLPATWTFQAGQGAGWDCPTPGGAAVVCSLANLAAGADSRVSLRMTTTTAGISTHTLDVGSPATIEMNLDDNAFLARQVVYAPADLSITQLAGPDPVQTGAPLTYTLTITNNGPVAASGIRITDTLPTGATFITATANLSATACQESSGVVTCTLHPALNILLADDTGNSWGYYSYAWNLGQSLDNLLIPYTRLDVSTTPPDAAALAPYSLVLWITSPYTNLDASEETALAGYLAGGGRLVLISSSYFHTPISSLMSNYLGVESGVADVRPGAINGQHTFAGLGPYTLNGNQWVDQLNPNAQALAAFSGPEWWSGPIVPVAVYTPRTVYLGFDWDSMVPYGSDGAAATEMLSAILDHLSPRLAAGASTRVTLQLNAPALGGVYTNTAQVSAFSADFTPANNQSTLAVNVLTEQRYVGPGGECGGLTPCYASIQAASDAEPDHANITVLPGTYIETVTLNRSMAVTFQGDVILNGNFTFQAGTLTLNGNLTLSGDYLQTGGAFLGGGGNLTVLGDFTLAGGGFTTPLGLLDVVGLTTHSSGSITYTANAVIREQRGVPVGGGVLLFPLADVTIDVTTAGSLSHLLVERYEQHHPNATSPLQTGRYWHIDPIGVGYTATLTLPAGFVTSIQDKVCRYTGSGQTWDCAATAFAGQTVTRSGITEFSDWAVGQNSGPTAVVIHSLRAIPMPTLPIIPAIALVGVGLGVLLWRRRKAG
jgi:uncharacterized repeat protein (TIGR01451 family)